MLTHHDRTVTDPTDVYEQVRGCGLRYVGFKDIGAGHGAARGLRRGARRRPGGHARGGVDHPGGGASLGARPRRDRRGLAAGRDASRGRAPGAERGRGAGGERLKYCPFPGTVVGHPSVLQGEIAEIAESARQITELDGVYGLDLLAYRHQTADAGRADPGGGPGGERPGDRGRVGGQRGPDPGAGRAPGRGGSRSAARSSRAGCPAALRSPGRSGRCSGPRLARAPRDGTRGWRRHPGRRPGQLIEPVRRAGPGAAPAGDRPAARWPARSRGRAGSSMTPAETAGQRARARSRTPSARRAWPGPTSPGSGWPRRPRRSWCGSARRDGPSIRRSAGGTAGRPSLLRRAPPGRPRGRDPPAHRAAAGGRVQRAPKLRLAARRRPGRPPPGRSGRAAVRRRQLLADLEPQRRPRARDRAVDGRADHAVQPGRVGLGSRTCSTCSASRPRCFRRWPARPGRLAVTDPRVCGGRAVIAASVGDQQAALFGQRCWRAGMAKLTLGTGAFLWCHAGAAPRRRRCPRGGFQLRLASSPAGGRGRKPPTRSRGSCPTRAASPRGCASSACWPTGPGRSSATAPSPTRPGAGRSGPVVRARAVRPGYAALGSGAAGGHRGPDRRHRRGRRRRGRAARRGAPGGRRDRRRSVRRDRRTAADDPRRRRA